MSEQDVEAYPCWYLDEAHSIPPWTPLFAWSWVHGNHYGDLWAGESIGLPRCHGTDWREIDGCAYMSPVLVADKEEVRQREARFKKHLELFIGDYDRIWEDVVRELTTHYDEFKTFDVDNSPTYKLYDHLERVFNFNLRVWALHSWMMYSLYELYALFEELCREQVGIDDTSPQWHQLMRGFDNKLFESDRWLWRLSQRAAKLGLDSVFKNNPDGQVLPALEEMEGGRRWLNEPRGFREFVQEHGWRLPRMVEFNCQAWVENPTPAISFIKQYLAKRGNFELDARRKQLIKQREEAEREVLSKFAQSEQGWVTMLMKAAQRAGSFSEEHTFYFEQTSHSLMRRAALACGKRIAAKSLLEDPEDFVYLLPDEIKKNIISLRLDYRRLASERKIYYHKYCQRLPRPDLIGKLSSDPEAAVRHMLASGDKVMAKITVGRAVKPKPELKADLYGNSASPGVATGLARLIFSETDIVNIKPGEVLVGVTTYSSWTPVFPLLKGIVLDRGASLSHAAIVGREYDIPVVVQTGEATSKLKSGQRIKVDGTKGAVWILPDN
jgi:phosphohistidine swiveling domain-containing protein